MLNKMELVLPAQSKNEALSRSIVGAFAVELPFTVEDINDIKTAVSEAVTNAIVHGYNSNEDKEVYINCELYSDKLVVKVRDYGVGIANVEEALQPFFTSKPEQERSGMGFTIMNAFMDSLEVNSTINEGTEIIFTKNLKNV